ncbi:hypothetical protein B0I35DRAFT_214745 [Stachybotrys elegans]|uniref:Uncharacterized protein n=1 Tax=Stachybotrys elegans TaxID=80388 RepID=A0A8K0SAM4_9HYPO|nr:hypothetical protein B0I35DRAFT_214745 [Stachybotrys elegans]
MANTSIFEYLTIENPRVMPRSEGRGNTSNQGYFTPRKLKEWEDFNMGVFKQLYDGQLIQEAYRRRDGFHIPHIDRVQKDLEVEGSTVHLLEHWTIFMTKTALRTVENTLHPTTWSPSPWKPKASTLQQDGGKKKKKRSDMADYKTKRKNPSRLKVDITSVLLCTSCEERDKQSFWRTNQRMPKEVKVYPNFSSTRTLDRLDQDGFWDTSKRNLNDEMPVRQAYTYCVRSGCRYGCILTSHEAFVFRIRPLDGENGSFPNHSNRQRAQVVEALRDRGLMEYKVIPWTNYRSEDSGDLHKFEELTINFSLWVLHILAGNSHEVQWNYGSLTEELLTRQACSLHTVEAPFATSFTETSSRKRRRGEENPDGVFPSFQEYPIYNPRTPDLPYLEPVNSMEGEGEGMESAEQGEFISSSRDDGEAQYIQRRKSSRLVERTIDVTQNKRQRRASY